MHRGHQRLGVAEQAHGLLVERRGVARVVLAAEVGARAEGPAFGREHDGTAIGIGIELREPVGQFAQQRHIEVVERRAPQLEQRHVRMARFQRSDRAHCTSSFAMST
jgi:hypothetical protein